MTEQQHRTIKEVKCVYIDCCELREAIQNVFGSRVQVKLDLFHPLQRITRTLPKRHALFHQCINDLRLVFRVEGDVGEQRQLTTPAGGVIASKFDAFTLNVERQV